MAVRPWLPLLILAAAGTSACAGAQKPRYTPTLPPIEMVLVKGGCFQMGTANAGPEERPVHEVCVDDFQLGKTEITQAQWKAVMGSNPSANPGCGDACPVENVSWNDVQLYVKALNALAGEQGAPAGYRLPTEAEWEYAARSGGKEEKYAGLNTESAEYYAWCEVNSGNEPHPVGLLEPNGLGLRDMTGNVWEWTGDWFDETYYAHSPRSNPTGPASGARRVLRGGGALNQAFDLRTSYRNYLPPDFRGPTKGFRLVRTAPGTK